jgi:HK97 family phage portal protein
MRIPWRRREAPIPAETRDFTHPFTLGQPSQTLPSPGGALQKWSGWCGIAVRPIVDRIAGLQWEAVNDGGEKVEKSDFVDLLKNPNPTMDGAQLLRISAEWLTLAGDCYWRKVRGTRSGRTVELWPIAPDRVNIEWKSETNYVYHVSSAHAAEPTVVQPDDMVRAWRPLPSDPWVGWGVVAQVHAEIESESYWRDSVTRWFQSDARPAQYFEARSEDVWPPSPSQLESYSELWRRKHSRAYGEHSGTPAMVIPGWILKETAGIGEAENLSDVESTLAKKILSAAGVSEFLIGRSAEANRASAETAVWAFDRLTVTPWTELLVQGVNFALGPEFPGQKIQFHEWAHKDRLAEAEIDDKLLARKVLSVDEARAKRNLPPASWRGEYPPGQIQDTPYTGAPANIRGTKE